MVADMNGKDRGIGSDGNMVADMGRFPKCLVASGRSPDPEEIVDEHDPVGDDAIIPDGDEFADKGVGLDLAPIPDDHVSLNLDKGADKTIIADLAAVNVYRLNDSDVRPEFHITDLDMLDGWLVHTIPNLHFFGWKRKVISFPVSMDS